MLEIWEDDLADKRARLAQASLEIPIPGRCVPLYDFATFEAAHALEEKQKRSGRHSFSRYQDWDNLPCDPRAYATSSSTHRRPQVKDPRPAMRVSGQRRQLQRVIKQEKCDTTPITQVSHTLLFEY